MAATKAQTNPATKDAVIGLTKSAARPEEIASAVLWLCSPTAAFAIGHALVVDGGQTAQRNSSA